jgi:hypothetical protein
MELYVLDTVAARLRKPSSELQEMLDQHSLWLASATRQGQRISNEDYPVDLSGLDLEGVNLSRALLSGANFKGSSLLCARFADAELSTASFIGCDLRNADFKNADVSLAFFHEAKLEGANFQGARTTATLWTRTYEDVFFKALREGLGDVQAKDRTKSRKDRWPAHRHRSSRGLGF